MAKLINKIAIMMAKTEEEKMEAILATKDLNYIRAVIEGKKVRGLSENVKLQLLRYAGVEYIVEILEGKHSEIGISLTVLDKLELAKENNLVKEILENEIKIEGLNLNDILDLIRSANLEREVVTGKIKVKELTLDERIDLIKSANLEREVVTGKIKVESLTSNDLMDLIKSANLEREVVIGEIKVESLTSNDLMDLIKSANLERAVITGEIKVESLSSNDLIDLIRSTNLEREVVTGEIKVESLTSNDLIDLIRSINLAREVLMGEIEVEGLEPGNTMELIKSAGLEKEVITGEIKVGRLTTNDLIDLIKSGNLGREVLTGEIKVEGLMQRNIVYLVESFNLEREVLTGEIKVEGLTKDEQIRLAKNADLEIEVLSNKIKIEGIETKEEVNLMLRKSQSINSILDGELEIEGLTKEDILKIIEKNIEIIKDRAPDKELTLECILQAERNEIYLHMVRMALYGELDASVLRASNIDKIMEVKDILGPTTVFSLLKNEDSICYDKIIEHPEEFMKFYLFSKNIFPPQPVESLEAKSIIEMYNENFELINDCFSSQLSERDKKMLEVVLSEEGIPKEILSKDDLEDFPQIRREKFAEMIEGGDDEVITYLLTGMSRKEYDEIFQKYMHDSQITDIFENFSEEQNSNFQKIKAVSEAIKLIQSLDEEKRKSVLRAINNELANEFEEQGSEIADMRRAFQEVGIQVKRLYGKELSKTLEDVKLPETIYDEELGIDVIKLDGQDFKLLIHMAGKPWGNSAENHIEYRCTSLISPEHMERYRGSGEYCFVFKNVAPNALILESPGSHLCSNSKIHYNNVKVYQYNFTTTDNFMENSPEGENNEIDLWFESIDENGEKCKLTPTHMAIFGDKIDPIRHKDFINEAKRLNIPIILIDEEKYKERSRWDEKDELQQPKKGTRLMDISVQTLSRIAEIAPVIAQSDFFEQCLHEMEQANKGERTKAHEK